MVAEGRAEDVPVVGEIRLGQFLKLAGLVDTGGQARSLLQDGAVTVNGEVDDRRGRQLRRGDVVGVHSRRARVS